MKRLAFDVGYWGPTLEFSGVIEFLPYLVITRWAGAGGYVGIGWFFWYANLEWRPTRK